MKKSLLYISLCSLSLLSAQAQRANRTPQATTCVAAWASKDVHYPTHLQRSDMPLTTDTLISAWKGERVGALALVNMAGKEEQLSVRLSAWKKGRITLPDTLGQARFVSYVTTDNFQSCGYHPNHLTPYEVADVIELNQPQTLTSDAPTRPVWCTLEVPQNCEAGTYQTQLEVVNEATGKVMKKLTLRLNVNNRTLPTPQQQKFHVDFWQQPYAVSRYHNVVRWSDAHFEALRPYLKLLARSGQKVVSAILFYEPWGDQSHDKFDAMVSTTRTAQGEWQYDYNVFDRWVTLCQECGIDEQINCFSMVPWDMTFRYYDEAQGHNVDLKTATNSKEYEELWTHFLQNFAQHLKEKGWFDKTCIAMDERGLDNMLDAYRVAQKAVPGIKMALAGTHHKELVDKLYDYCIGFGENFSTEELSARQAKGYISTTYTCCSNDEPNLFSNSLPAEAAYLPLFCLANHFEGYLHWSWMNWADNPLHDSRFRLFAPGDTYLIYPGPRSSVRYERFIEGVAMAEKVRLLRKEYEQTGNKQALNDLNQTLERFAPAGIPNGETASSLVNAIQRLLNP